jgi:hypothetical protein
MKTEYLQDLGINGRIIKTDLKRNKQGMGWVNVA